MLIFTVKYCTKIYFISVAEVYWCPLNFAPKVNASLVIFQSQAQLRNNLSRVTQF